MYLKTWLLSSINIEKIGRYLPTYLEYLVATLVEGLAGIAASYLAAYLFY